MKDVVIDGANGFIGSNLCSYFGAQDRRVMLLTRKLRDDALYAVNAAELGLCSDDQIAALETYSYSLADSGNMGLSDLELGQIFSAPCDYWHVAASVDLSSRNPARLFSTNVEGTRRALDMFADHAQAGSRFLLLSTAYSCGIQNQAAPERWFADEPLDSFRTYYEASKRHAELLVREYMETRGVEGIVLRPSQVVGHSVTGATRSEAGLYGFIGGLLTLARRHPDASVRIRASSDATLNMVPIDQLIRWMVGVADEFRGQVDPPIVHLVDVKGVPASDVAAVVTQEVPIELLAVPPAELRRDDMTALERLVDARLRYTGRYIEMAIGFERKNLVSLLGTGPTDATVDVDALADLVRWYVQSKQKSRSSLDSPVTNGPQWLTVGVEGE